MHITPRENAVFFVAIHVGDRVQVIRREGMDEEIYIPYGHYIVSIIVNDERRNKTISLCKEFISGKVDTEFRWI